MVNFGLNKDFQLVRSFKIMTYLNKLARWYMGLVVGVDIKSSPPTLPILGRVYTAGLQKWLLRMETKTKC